MKNIFQIVQEYEDDFVNKEVRITEGYFFSQQETIKRINLYSAGQFLNGSEDEFGEKVFYDIVTPAVRNFAKNIDLDTKDINFRATNGQDYFKSWVYRRRAKNWMRDTGVARKLNELADKLTGMGTVLLKKVPSKEIFKVVDLRNFACDPTAKSIAEGWAIETLYYTPTELEGMKKSGWNAAAIDNAIKNFLDFRRENYVGEDDVNQEYGDAQYIKVREVRGHFPAYLLDEAGESDDATPVLSYFAVIMPNESGQEKGKANKKAIKFKKAKQGLELFKSRITSMPYKEVHFRRIDGRWLGRGIYEECFPAQEMKNSQVNWLLVAMRISQLILFQTRNNTVLSNVITDLKNGDILKFAEGNGDPLSRVDTRITDNASNQTLAREVGQLVASLSNSYEVTTGENLPSGTPYSLGALQDRNADKLFDRVREDFGILIKEVVDEWVLPELEKEMTKKGVLEITDKDDLAYIQENMIKANVWNSIKKMLFMGKRPTLEQVTLVEDFITTRSKEPKAIFLDIQEDFLKFDKRVETVVTNENESPALMQSLTTIMQTVAQQPQILEMPAFQRILDIVGISKNDVMTSGGGQQTPPQQQLSTGNPQQGAPVNAV